MSPLELSIGPHQGPTLIGILRGLLGISFVLGVAYLCSSRRRSIPWKTVGLALLFQALLALGILKIRIIQSFFDLIGKVFTKILDFSEEGSRFLFGWLAGDTESFGYIFAFQILPTIVFFSALTSIGYYFGIIQRVVGLLGRLLSRALGISGAESLSIAGNIFLGQTEAPLLIKRYLPKMTRSEILLVMVGGMSTVAGGVLASYILLLGGGNPEVEKEFARHFVAASVMAAPAAILISKMLIPSTEVHPDQLEMDEIGAGSNLLDAISKGTTEGVKLAVNVGAMLMVFMALIALMNGLLGWIGGGIGLNGWISEHTGYPGLSLEFLLGNLFAPVMWLIGVPAQDLSFMGQLLGIKLVASEFIAYGQLDTLKDAAQAPTLAYRKSVIMATYMLCGFANFASIGIQIGGIGVLAPEKRVELSELGLRAVLGGTLASLLSAVLTGMILG